MGRGEEARFVFNDKPLSRALSPLRRGEGVGASERMRLHEAAFDDQSSSASGLGDDTKERLVAGNSTGKQQFVSTRLFDLCSTSMG